MNTDLRTILDKEWMWPATDTSSWRYLTQPKHLYLPVEISEMLDSKRTVIQAGGHCGLYPYQYASIFDQVITFEPESTNLACLRENTKEKENLKINNCALGNINTTVSLFKNDINTGCTRIDDSARLKF